MKDEHGPHLRYYLLDNRAVLRMVTQPTDEQGWVKTRVIAFLWGHFGIAVYCGANRRVKP